jgi:hypothetical protein
MKKVVALTFLLAALCANAEKNKGLIDLGSGEVESDIQGAQYLLRIRGSLEDRIKNLEASVDQQAFKEIEARHLKLAQSEKTK